MQLVEKLEHMIEDEIHDVKKYAKLAAELKAEHPSLAQALYTIATQEDSHQATIHNEVVKIVEDYKRKNGEPPQAMLAVYEYLHRRHVEELAEARRYLDVFKNS